MCRRKVHACVLLSPGLGPQALTTTPDAGDGFLGGDATLCGAHLSGVLQRVVPRAAAHIRFYRLQPATSRSRYTIVAVSEEQPLCGVEDDDGRQCVEHLGVLLHPRGVEMRLGIDRRVREEIGYSQLRHHCALIVALNSKVCNPYLRDRGWRRRHQ